MFITQLASWIEQRLWRPKNDPMNTEMASSRLVSAAEYWRAVESTVQPISRTGQ